MKRIDFADLIVIAEQTLGRPAPDLHRSVDRALAEAALAAPFSGLADREFFPHSHQKIGVLGYRLARYHPFPDGNKRVAWVAMREVAARNRIRWELPPNGEDQAVRVMEECAAGAISEEQFIEFIGVCVDADSLKAFREMSDLAAFYAEHGGFLGFLEVEEEYLQGVGVRVTTSERVLARLDLGGDQVLMRVNDLVEAIRTPQDRGTGPITPEAFLVVGDDLFERFRVKVEVAEHWVRVRVGEKQFQLVLHDLEQAIEAALASDAEESS